MNKTIEHTIQTTIQARIQSYQALALAIHQQPEVSNHEFFACKSLSELLRNEGFHVVENVAGHRTGFDARYQSNKPGPVVVFLAEYDALAGIGHACGHNLFGMYSCLAGVALKSVIDQIGGEVRVYGTPGEEGGENGSAKGSFVREGYFNDVDVALCAHPGRYYGPTSKTTANAPVEINFYGKAAHAAGSPDQGISALDALLQFFNSVNGLRFTLPKGTNVHGIITKGGDAANVIPEHTTARFYLRAQNKYVLNELYDRIYQIAEGVAQATGTQVNFELFQNQVDDTIVTPAFDQLFVKHLKESSIPETDWQLEKDHNLGSSDVGNVSYVVPVIQPTVSIADHEIPGHSLAFKEAAASQKGLDSIPLIAEILVKVSIDLIQNPELLEEIKQNHQDMLAKVEA